MFGVGRGCSGRTWPSIPHLPCSTDGHACGCKQYSAYCLNKLSTTIAYSLVFNNLNTYPWVINMQDTSYFFRHLLSLPIRRRNTPDHSPKNHPHRNFPHTLRTPRPLTRPIHPLAPCTSLLLSPQISLTSSHSALSFITKVCLFTALKEGHNGVYSKP